MPRPRKQPEPPPRRDRGTGSATFRKRDEIWEARLPRALGRGTAYFKTRDAAITWLDGELLRAVEARRVPGRDEPLGAYLARWHRRHEPGWATGTAHGAQHLLLATESIAGLQIGDLRVDIIGDWVGFLLREGGQPDKEGKRHGLARSTVKVLRGKLRMALQELVPDVLTSNPVRGQFRAAEAEVEVRKHFEELEARRFLRAAAATPSQVLFRLMLGTGLRIGEALGLRWEDLDLDAGELYLEDQWRVRDGKRGPTKGRRKRPVELTAPVLAALSTLPSPHEGLVFKGTIDGRPIGGRTVLNHFAMAVEATKPPVPNIGPHGLRHTFATLALSRGVPLATVSEALGHSSTAITASTYAHALKERSGAAERALAEVLAWV